MNDFANMIWSPDDYRSAAFLAEEAGMEMLSRLDFMTIKPEVIVEAGCGLGQVAEALAQKYPAAKILAVDTSAEMLAACEVNTRVEYRSEDAAKLSFEDHSVDLLCANFLLPWVTDVQACLQEWKRVLRPNGVLMVSTLGVGTLQSLQASQQMLAQCIDVHDLGDALVAAGFIEPVMDVARVPVRYREKSRMLNELIASGILREMPDTDALELDVDFEVLHGHAFAPMPSSAFRADEDGTVRIPLNHLRLRRNSPLSS
jgi:malonyl-CoA O-methyltransferase